MGLFLILSATAFAIIIAWALWRRPQTPPVPSKAAWKVWRWVITAVVIAVFLLVVVIGLQLGQCGPVQLAPPITIGPPQKEPNEAIVAVMLFASMIAGMAAKVLWDVLAARKRNKPMSLDPWAFVRPMLISPIIFAAVWKGRESGFDLMTICFAFQNGFIWQTIFGKAIGQG